ncbi:MAG TPA: FkbM family methyltransferase [Puia sp.]|jgi:hypothetical protein|nr:FkbM family methyltransferase [Puia sp.]
MVSEALQIIRLDGLKRFGKNNDGGYVCSESLVKACKTLLSFGINDDWSFEKDFTKLSGATCYGFDYSIHRTSFLKKGVKEFRFFGGDIIKRRKFTPERIAKGSRHINDFIDFNLFFLKNRFYSIGLDTTSQNPNFLDIKTIIDKYLPSQNDFFLKMDIEGMEYEVMGDVLKFQSRIPGIALEVHSIHNKIDAFENMLSGLQNYYYIYHIHANNYASLDRVHGFPDVVELSLIRKDLIAPPSYHSSLCYLPLETLDMLNDPSGKEYVWEV